MNDGKSETRNQRVSYPLWLSFLTTYFPFLNPEIGRDEADNFKLTSAIVPLSSETDDNDKRRNAIFSDFYDSLAPED